MKEGGWQLEVSQIIQIGIQILSLVYSVFITSLNKTDKVLLNTFIANILSLLVYLCFREISTALTIVVVAIRSFCCIYRDKFKTDRLMYVFISMHLGIMCYAFNLESVLVATACSIATYVTWKKDAQGIRVGCSLSDALWLVYSIGIGAHIQSAVNLIGFTSKVYYSYKYKLTVKNDRHLSKEDYK